MVDGLASRAFLFDASAPGATTDIITTSRTNLVTGNAFPNSYLQPSVDCSYAVSVVLETTSVFYMTETYGGVTNTYTFNSGASLTANYLYAFTVPVMAAATYNFQVATNGIIGRLVVDELQNGATA